MASSNGLCRYGARVDCCWGWTRRSWGHCQRECHHACCCRGVVGAGNRANKVARFQAGGSKMLLDVKKCCNAIAVTGGASGRHVHVVKRETRTANGASGQSLRTIDYNDWLNRRKGMHSHCRWLLIRARLNGCDWAHYRVDRRWIIDYCRAKSS